MKCDEPKEYFIKSNIPFTVQVVGMGKKCILLLMFIITIIYLRSRLCGVICKFHFFSLDFIEALFTVYVSVRKKPICPFSVIFEGDDEDDENAIYNSITAQAENNWGKRKKYTNDNYNTTTTI